MTHSHDSHDAAHHDATHHDPAELPHGGNGKYWGVFVALCLLTLCSFFTYFQWWDETIPPSVSRAFMLAVSCGKALLVMLFFMHLLWEANWKWVLTVPAGMTGVFLVCMLIPDIGYRTEYYSQERWLHAPVPQAEAEEAADPAPAAAH